MEEKATFSEEAIDFANQHPILGPEYHASTEFMERFAKHFRDEHLQPMAEEVTKEVCDRIRDRVWNDFQSYIIRDAEIDVADEIRNQVAATVKAILSGDDWAMNRYPLSKAYDAEALRAAIAKHIEEPLAKKRIEDLEAENNRLVERIRFFTDRGGY